jgi:hypothetical protein
VGNERHAFTNTDNPDASHQLQSRGGSLLATLENLYLQPAGMQVGSLVVALPRLCLGPPGHFVVTGLLRRLARCIT